ncbi:MAG TPA: hypothetical protein VD765_12170 [Solirubrobacterales bacterium]|nr:hypothetical protein [Solirubrobacterales bacterium]
MDPDLRGALLIGGLLFVAVFAAMTIQVVIEDGLTVLTVIAAVIVVLLALPLVGALFDRNR